LTDKLLEYRDALLAAAEEDASSEGSLCSADHLVGVVARMLEDVGIVENVQMLPFDGVIGSARSRISGIALDEDAETLVLIAGLLSQPDIRLGLAEIRTAADRALRFYNEAIRDGLARAEGAGQEVREFARRIEAAAQQISLVRIVVLTDAEIPGAVMQERLIEGTRVRFEIFDIQRLLRVLGEGASREDIEINLEEELGHGLACLKVSSANDEYDTYLAALPGNLLSEIYSRYGTRLLELNVRAFLGVRGKKTANAGLRETLLNYPTRFLAFNNGIVATVDDVQTNSDGSGPAITRLKGLQIVNGGQTTASLSRARSKDRASLAGVIVPAKIIHVKKDPLALDQMVASISRSANTQNTIQPADFSANDPFHREVERLANNSWSPDGRTRWFYERARGTYGVAEDSAGQSAITRRLFKIETPKERRFSKTDLAKYIAAWEGRPYEVARGGQKNFQLFMQRLKQAPIQVDEQWFKRLVALVITYRSTERLVRQAGFPAYRALIAAYTFALIGQLTGGRMDFGMIWDRQSLSEAFEVMIQEWASIVDGLVRETAGSRMPTEWAKRDECWEAIRARMPKPPAELPPELLHQTLHTFDTSGSTRASLQLSAEDYELIQRTMELDAGKLLEISETGKREGLIHWKVAAICQTVATYAAGGWSKRPSAKQCRIVMEAVDRVAAAVN
jgi:hypothetical protein